MNKKVIYSAVVGGYDTIKQPEVVSDEFDYVLFSNDITEERVGVWQIRPIKYTNPIQTKIARYIKTHPEELLAEYDYSVWIDQNIIIKTDQLYNQINTLIANKTAIASMPNIFRDCIYDEAIGVIGIRVEHEDVVLRWASFLHKEGFPRHFGLFETNVLFREHNKASIVAVDNLWWDCIDKHSRRDQLSLNYVLWKLNVKANYIIDAQHSVRNSSGFELLQHKELICNELPLGKWESWIMRNHWSNTKSFEEVSNIYLAIFKTHFPCFWAFVVGQYLRIKKLNK